MKDFIEILKTNGIEVPDEAKEAIRKEHSENYKANAEFDKKVKRLEEQLQSANDTIADLKAKADNAEELNKRIAEYEQADKDRQEAEKKAKETQARKSRFDVLKGERKYLNEGTESWIFSEFEKALADDKNAGKSDSEIFEDITKDKTIFVSENQRFENPSAGGNSGGGDDKPKFKSFF